MQCTLKFSTLIFLFLVTKYSLIITKYFHFIPCLVLALCGVAGKHVCCGYEDGAVKVVDLKSGSTVASLSGGVTADHGTAAEATTRTVGDGHGGSVTSIAAHGDGALLITGSEDGTSKLINSTNGKVCGETVGVVSGIENYLSEISYSGWWL